MNDMESLPVQQLWYTWSDVGLSSVHAGFRVRAASPALTEIYSERVKSMDRYMRYALPPGANRATVTREIAPIGLAFLRTEWNKEYILVHKNYSGEDGVGRPGNFFAHLLALGEASSSFSAEDAIWLWDADFWKTDHASLDRRSNTLDTIPLGRLDANPHFHPQFAQVRSILPFVIEAYLTRKGKASLYIAAPAHQTTLIASVIAGLTRCLPTQLFADLTFSTYEPDITKAATDIIGTSWISVPGQESDASQVLPSQWYRDHLASNCQTGERSQLQGHPQILPHPLAADFAAYATECLITNSTDQLDELCRLAGRSQGLTTDLFLQLYNSEIANTDSVKEPEIELYLNHPTLCVDRLSSRTFRKQIVELVRENPQWGEERLLPILSSLRKRAEKEYAGSLQFGHTPLSSANTTPGQEQYAGAGSSSIQKKSSKNQAGSRSQKPQLTLAEVLSLLAQRAISEVVDSMKKGWSGKEITADDPSSKRRIDSTMALLHMMNEALVDTMAGEVWQQLFDDVLASTFAVNYLKAQWRIRFFLLQIWNRALPVTSRIDDAIRPLVLVPWTSLGKFLTVSLKAPHLQWTGFALEKLVTDTSLTPQTARELEQTYAAEISLCLSHLIQEAKSVLVANFLRRLIEQGFSVTAIQDGIVEQLFTNLSSPQERHSWPVARELVVTLLFARYSGSVSYQERIERFLDMLLLNDPAMGNEFLDRLIEGQYSRKYQLLEILRRVNGDGQLERCINRIYRTPDELNTFFLQYGGFYLQGGGTQAAMLSLYKKLYSYFPQRDKKLALLFVCLDAPLEERTTLHILEYAPLERDEQAKILERSGQKYLREGSALATMVVKWFALLAQTGYPGSSELLFTILTPKAEYKHVKELLKVAHLSLPDIQRFFKIYGFEKSYIGSFLKSRIALELFDQLVQAAYNNAGSVRGKQLVEEKMALIAAWLDPANLPLSGSEDAGKAVSAAENLLRIAALTETEWRTFLELYGSDYLLFFPLLPSLLPAISMYMQNFTSEMLDQPSSQRFLLALAQQCQRISSVDSTTAENIQQWYAILHFYSSPSASPAALKSLISALYIKGLPNTIQEIRKLTTAFVSCIHGNEDLQNIMSMIQSLPGIQRGRFQFLYILAESAAKVHRGQEKRYLLLPYLVFALQEKSREGGEHFRHVFLDILLYDLHVRDLNGWRMLNTQLVQQPGFLGEVQIRWREYLLKLELLEHLSTVHEAEKGASRPARKISFPSWSTRSQLPGGKKEPAPGEVGKQGQSAARNVVQPDPGAPQFPPDQGQQPRPFSLEEDPEAHRRRW